MSDHEHHTAGSEARGAVPGRRWRPDEPVRGDALLRYLGAVAAVSAAHASEEPRSAAGPEALVRSRPHGAASAKTAGPRVRDVMDVPAVSVGRDTSFLEIARTLSHERLSAVPVVDADDHVIGMVSESDLLAKAAVEAAEHRPGPVGRLLRHRLYDKAAGEKATTLMTSPAITVHPGTAVAEAAWLAAGSRLKRLPVVDHRGRLVGVVRRQALLQALVRDDEKIREEIESRVIEREFRLGRDALQVSVDNGVVRIQGRMDLARIPQLLAEIRDIEDVTDVVDHLTAG